MKTPPNVLLVTCHDLGRHLRCYGRNVHSPTLDALASQSVRFDRYFCTAPQCSPSRVSITTGRYPHSADVMGLVNPRTGWELRDVPTLAMTLAEAGWSTHLWGFQHEHHDAAALGYQHDEMGYTCGEVPKILASAVAPKLCKWLEGKPRKPFFASVGFFETHIPFWQKPEFDASGERPARLPHLPEHPALHYDLMGLNASVYEVDVAMKRILDALARSGQEENTIVIFTTDHGIAFPKAKCSLYDAGLETALLVRWPDRFAESRVVTELLSNIDLMPTLLELCGVPVPDGVQGQSFAGLLMGGTYRPRDEIFAEMTWHESYNPMRAIRTNRYKLIHYFDPQPWNLMPQDFWKCCASAPALRSSMDHRPPEWELFDLANDPLELANLAELKYHRKVQKVREDLSARLQHWMEETRDPLLNGPVPSAVPA